MWLVGFTALLQETVTLHVALQALLQIGWATTGLNIDICWSNA